MSFFKHFKNIIPTAGRETSPCTQTDSGEIQATKIFKPMRTDHIQLEQQTVTRVARLRYSNYSGELTEYQLGSARINIGRIYGNEICIRDAKASRLHAFIVAEKDAHILYDAQSTNGTYVNGKKVTQHRLCDGDQIRIGNTLFEYN